MLMGFLGCLGAIYEIRCLLGLYFTCLLLIVIAQVVAGALIYFQKETVSDVTSSSSVLDFIEWCSNDVFLKANPEVSVPSPCTRK
ncbi:CD82 antigen-like [Notothenia coriiceps]|uniref:CD82 antigen-like n=1 Tax=Notothenia coriiceps TaxID=8208 RepID=A0A6I9MDQ6_9TELE|nr:PREDICTED: CD82 antigen-like [Notothenia coriiceps]